SNPNSGGPLRDARAAVPAPIATVSRGPYLRRAPPGSGVPGGRAAGRAASAEGTRPPGLALADRVPGAPLRPHPQRADHRVGAAAIAGDHRAAARVRRVAQRLRDPALAAEVGAGPRPLPEDLACQRGRKVVHIERLETGDGLRRLAAELATRGPERFFGGR